jgi:hypothetical protein
MNYRLSTILLATALLVVLGVSSIQAAPAETVKQTATGDYDFTNYGTAWVPEQRTYFAAFTPKGWGTAIKPKAAGSVWVHIPIPVAVRISDTTMKVKDVEFCAKSSNGAGGTGPAHMDVYSDGGLQWSMNITWWADNSYHCYHYFVGTPVWLQDVGISVSLHFTNATDIITLYKAWVRVTP